LNGNFDEQRVFVEMPHWLFVSCLLFSKSDRLACSQICGASPGRCSEHWALGGGAPFAAFDERWGSPGQKQ